jgi:hypothetical protein
MSETSHKRYLFPRSRSDGKEFFQSVRTSAVDAANVPRMVVGFFALAFSV